MVQTGKKVGKMCNLLVGGGGRAGTFVNAKVFYNVLVLFTARQYCGDLNCDFENQQRGVYPYLLIYYRKFLYLL